LERIFRILIVAEHAFAHAPDHRRVPAHQCRKGGFIALGKEALEQLSIGYGFQLRASYVSAKKLDNPGDGHRSSLTSIHSIPAYYFPDEAVLLHDFSRKTARPRVLPSVRRSAISSCVAFDERDKKDNGSLRRTSIRVKLLYWLGDGLAIWYRRLEEGTFAFPRAAGEKGLSWSRAVGEHGLEIRAADLAMLLEAVDLGSGSLLCL
jgi:hypothetical protein